MKKEKTGAVLIVIERKIVGPHQGLRKTTTESLLVKKRVEFLKNLLDLKRSLVERKKSLLTNFQKNLGNLSFL